jgi:hypothetical protein
MRPRPAVPPKPRAAIEISVSIVWEAPEVDTAPVPEASETARPRQSKRAPQLTTPRNRDTLPKPFSVYESPSGMLPVTEAKRAANPTTRFSTAGETSLCLDDDSKFDDITSFYNRIGLYANE